MLPRGFAPRAIALLVGAGIGVLGIALAFGSWDAFVRAVDFNHAFFEDFRGPYYETGKRVLGTGHPAPGFYSPAFFALVLAALVRAFGDASAWVWLGLQIASFATIAYATAQVARLRATWSTAALGALVASSFPLAHNLHWGQVSAPLVALLLLALVARARGHARLAALAIAVAAAVKLHPALFVLPFVAWSERRTVAWTALLSLLLLVVLPAVVLGPERALDFHRVAARELARASSSGGLWAGAANAQHLPAVVERLLGSSELVRLLATGAGLVLAGALLWRVARLDSRAPDAIALAFVGVWLATPLVVPPSWPHYFSFLPICQCVLAAALARARPRPLGTTLAFGGIAASAVLASTLFFRWIGDHERYGRLGFLLWADLALLPAFALATRVSAALASDRDEAQPDRRR